MHQPRLHGTDARRRSLSFIDEAARELNAKIVYVGPQLAGKTTTLEKLVPASGHLRTLESERGERTLTFDFTPNLPPIRGFTLRVHAYAAVGSVFFLDSSLQILRGVSGVVFVADSQFERLEANLESIDRLHRDLEALGVDAETLPIVFQHNKRDLPNVASTKLLDRLLAVGHRQSFASCAKRGEGVRESFIACVEAVHAELERAPSVSAYR